MPRRAQNRRQKKHRAEVNDGRRGECGASFRRGELRPAREEREDDELQSDQRARRAADDDVEALPLGELGHLSPQSSAAATPALPCMSKNSVMNPGTVSLRFQSRCSSQNSCVTLIILPPACSTRRNAMSWAMAEVPPTASSTT